MKNKKDWKKFEWNNKSIAINILYAPYNIKEIRHAYKSKRNLKHENQAVLLMITDGEKSHYLAAKELPALLKGIASNHKGDFYYLNYFHLFRIKKMFKKYKNVLFLLKKILKKKLILVLELGH